MKPVNIRDLTNTILSKVPVVSLFIAGCILATPCEIVLAAVFTVSNTDDSGTGSCVPGMARN